MPSRSSMKPKPLLAGMRPARTPATHPSSNRSLIDCRRWVSSSSRFSTAGYPCPTSCIPNSAGTPRPPPWPKSLRHRRIRLKLLHHRKRSPRILHRRSMPSSTSRRPPLLQPNSRQKPPPRSLSRRPQRSPYQPHHRRPSVTKRSMPNCCASSSRKPTKCLAPSVSNSNSRVRNPQTANTSPPSGAASIPSRAAAAWWACAISVKPPGGWSRP
ncbi:hypothetical protein SDC9_161664 [bioreactor metagenome]|uniref:Uncharacterized protein n=1 Tax=bioreactor metagenome TaxID=1076179 RepID=A0A645FIZ6_9ZZZZ